MSEKSGSYQTIEKSILIGAEVLALPFSYKGLGKLAGLTDLTLLASSATGLAGHLTDSHGANTASFILNNIAIVESTVMGLGQVIRARQAEHVNFETPPPGYEDDFSPSPARCGNFFSVGSSFDSDALVSPPPDDGQLLFYQNDVVPEYKEKEGQAFWQKQVADVRQREGSVVAAEFEGLIEERDAVQQINADLGALLEGPYGNPDFI